MERGVDPTGKGVNSTGRGVDLPIGIYISQIDIVGQCLDIDITALGNTIHIWYYIDHHNVEHYIVLPSFIADFYLIYTAEGKHL